MKKFFVFLIIIAGCLFLLYKTGNLSVDAIKAQIMSQISANNGSANTTNVQPQVQNPVETQANGRPVGAVREGEALIFSIKYDIIGLSGENMIFDTKYVKININGYKNANDKIARMIKNNEMYSIIRGLYTDSINENKEAIASYILIPSYLSFEYALSKYQLIPEDVKVYTSATCGKRKKKIYETNFGTYTYYDVPRDIFKYGVNLIENKEYKYFIASPCKALCDKLYNTKALRSAKQLKEYLFDDLRIDKEEFEKLNKNDLHFLIDRYNSTNCKLLLKIIDE